MRKILTLLTVCLCLFPLISHTVPNVEASYANPITLDAATNIFIGRYTGNVVEYDSDKLPEFEVIENKFSSVSTETALIDMTRPALGFSDIVYGDSSIDFTFRSETVSFEKGKEYLIIAVKEVSVYYPQDLYSLISNAYIPTDSLAINLTYVLPLEHMDSVLLAYINEEGDPYDENNPYCVYAEDDVIYDRLIKLVATLTAESPYWKEYRGNEFIRSEDFEEIKAQSDIVVRVEKVSTKAWDLPDESFYYNCRVLECIKGNVPSDKIMVTFLKDTVENGGEYIVCLAPTEFSWYEISAKNAVQTVKTPEEVRAEYGSGSAPSLAAVIIIITSAAVLLIGAGAFTVIMLKRRRARAGVEETAELQDIN